MYRLENDGWLGTCAIILAITFLPRHRRALVTCGTFYWLLFHYSWCDWNMVRMVAARNGVPINLGWLKPVAAAGLFIFAGSFCWMVSHWRTARLMRRPILLLGLCYSVLVLGACYIPVSPAGRVYLWTAVTMLGSYFWFIGYTLLDRNSKTRDPLATQMGAWFPFWIGGMNSNTPFPKGAAYLRRIEARTPEDLAVTQIKGLKLLLWTLILSVTLVVYRNVVHDVASRPALRGRIRPQRRSPPVSPFH